MAYGNKKDAADKREAAHKELKRRLKDGDTEGLYVFNGEEEYMKRYYFSELCRAAGESVNVTVLRGEIDFGELCDELSSVPMQEFSFFDDSDNSSKKRVIKLDSPDFSKLSERELSEVYELLSDIGKLSVVVIYYSNIDPVKGKSNGTILKKISENALVCEFERALPGDATLLRWMKKHFDKEKITVLPEDIRYLSECVGTDMCLLSFEIEKLSAYLLHNGRNELRREDIDHICIKNTEAITFDVTNAILAGSFESAVDALAKLKLTKTEPLIIFGAISKMAGDLSIIYSMQKEGMGINDIARSSGLHEFVVKKYMAFLSRAPKGYVKNFTECCLEADEKLKRGGDGYIVLENLLFRLIIK